MAFWRRMQLRQATAALRICALSGPIFQTRFGAMRLRTISPICSREIREATCANSPFNPANSTSTTDNRCFPTSSVMWCLSTRSTRSKCDTAACGSCWMSASKLYKLGDVLFHDPAVVRPFRQLASTCLSVHTASQSEWTLECWPHDSIRHYYCRHRWTKHHKCDVLWSTSTLNDLETRLLHSVRIAIHDKVYCFWELSPSLFFFCRCLFECWFWCCETKFL